MRLPAFISQQRSLQAKFLSIILPLLLITLVIAVSIIDVVSRHNESRALSDKLGALVVAHAAGIAPSVWILDHERISLVLKSVVADPEVAGAAIIDEFGETLATEGNMETPSDPTLQRSENIRYLPSGSDEVIGVLTITITDALVQEAQQKRLVTALVFAAFLASAVVLSALVANRWSVGIPLQRLLESIQHEDPEHRRKKVDWDSNDELGVVIKAFNDHQLRRETYEKDLRSARDNLEQRVRERTIELVVARDEAELAKRSMTNFLASVSHELRTPLNAILGMTEVMVRGQLGTIENEKQLEYLNDVHYSGQYLLNLINDILDLSKIEVNQMEINDTTFDLRDALADAIRLCDSSGLSDKPVVTLDNPNDPVLIKADQRLVTQITVNLLSNAIKFTPAGGVIAVGSSIDEEGQCHIFVSDTGCGIEKVQLEHIIDPFVQGNDPYLRNSDGTGLGLSLVKAMVELHDGSIALTSTVGEGTRAEVTLPAARVISS